MALYPARFERYAEDEIVVSFRDLPECLTSGVDETEAMTEALDALEEAIVGRLDDGEEIPIPSVLQPGERYVEISLAAALAIWLNLPCRRCRIVVGGDIPAFLEDPESWYSKAAECDHPVMQNRDEVEAQYLRVIHHIENEDCARRLRSEAPQST